MVTHRRPDELKRLLKGLAESRPRPLGCVISDHAPGGEVPAIAAAAGLKTVVLENAANPGPGAGWSRAAKAALDLFPEAEAVWYLDDDVVIPPDGLEILLDEMTRAGADSIAPLLEDSAGRLWAFPEPESLPFRQKIRAADTPAAALALIGPDPVPFCWCTGACYLVKRSILESEVYHREDFWLLGEDLEYSMRIAAASKAVFTCRVTVPHLPPPASSPAAARKSDYVKFCSLLQNLTYLAFHSKDSRHMKRYLPGNYRRFLRKHSPLRRATRDAAACFWNGAIRAEPAGGPLGRQLRERIFRYDF